MNKLSTGIFWAIWPQAWDQLRTSLRLALTRIASGPVDDAERVNLPVQKHGNLAVISLEGPMLKNVGFLRFFGFADTKAVQRAVEAAAADDDIETIIMNIDSPGGSVDGLAELTDAVRDARAVKPVIAQVSGMAASAAYMVATQATQIFVGRMDLVGSIGTRIMLFDFSKMFEDAGVKAIPIDTGEFKSAGAMGSEITEAQIADFQRIVDGFFDDFVAAVSLGRGMTEKQVLTAGDGRVFFPAEALELGLIDGIQTFDQTFRQKLQPKGSGTTRARNAVRLRSQIARM